MRLQIKWNNGWAYAHGTGPDGKRIRRALKTKDHRRAEELRAHLEAKLWAVDLYGPQSVVTFDQAALAYAEDDGDTRFLVKMTEQLAGQLLREITPRGVREAAKRAYPTASNATRNRQGITPVRAVINYAHDQGWCAPIKVRAFPVEKAKRKAVGHDYLAKLQPHLPINLFALMLFLNTTGRRVGDAVGLTPDDIDFGEATAHISKTKNGEEATAHLVPMLLDILKEIMPEDEAAPVFGYRDRRSIYGTLKRACKNAGVEYLGTHQPGRHSFATSLEREGWSARAIADAGGWKSVRLVDETYIHTNDPAGRAASVIGAKLAKTIRKN
ncbi:tyrosine-type recombinase/integrase [Pacificoceanicola onchidii]|uniref:tyrosine-type recombinase/integrase n=1 Tax=Pacificoceanicola onchidii TaxID=2562685 RepID=UPI0010A41682|nr:tyrosine-type recombinase/integrase [Pacificoceanicola onchidii]